MHIQNHTTAKTSAVILRYSYAYMYFPFISANFKTVLLQQIYVICVTVFMFSTRITCFWPAMTVAVCFNLKWPILKMKHLIKRRIPYHSLQGTKCKNQSFFSMSIDSAAFFPSGELIRFCTGSACTAVLLPCLWTFKDTNHNMTPLQEYL